ncbi:MAG: hypothetical protein IPK52_11340 [Chloroflexi bacterium]|nr:hypothetical protein [Chloroflexota bacterium]
MNNMKFNLNPRLGIIGAIIGYVAGGVVMGQPLLGVVFALLIGGILGSGMASPKK